MHNKVLMSATTTQPTVSKGREIWLGRNFRSIDSGLCSRRLSTTTNVHPNKQWMGCYVGKRNGGVQKASGALSSSEHILLQLFHHGIAVSDTDTHFAAIKCSDLVAIDFFYGLPPDDK